VVILFGGSLARKRSNAARRLKPIRNVRLAIINARLN
jgi:hypothetical protein